MVEYIGHYEYESIPCSNKTPSSLEEGGETSSPGYHHADPFLYRILEEEAKKMRRFPTEAESVLWEIVRKKQLEFRFRRQFVIYILYSRFRLFAAKINYRS